jgi:ornithine cyclodeaminase/alanine dehydrogenase-like protein (mu-crystallin family)
LDDQGWSRVVELRNLKPMAAAQTIVFKSVGLGLEDVAAGAWVYERG